MRVTLRKRLNVQTVESRLLRGRAGDRVVPTADEVRSLFVELVNERVQQSILTGFVYEGCPVYLSMENQVTFRNSMTCPVRLKLGEAADGSPVYYEFTSASRLTAFQKAVGNHVQRCLDEGWVEKDAFDVEPYLRE